jgi:5-methyltetrahydrofolate--homocysteine methyltransferase
MSVGTDALREIARERGYARMNQLLFEGQHEAVKRMTEEALAAGRPAMEVLEEGLIAGMRVVGEDFRHNRVFVPEVLLAARAMKAGMAVLKPLLVERKEGERSAEFPVIVMGTVKGDLHDIGKNLVGMMAEGAGFTLVDLGTDTSAERFIAAVRTHGASLVGMSALLTTTMVYMRTVVKAFKDAGLEQVKICVGGAPVSAQYAKEIGADGYAADAASAVALFKRLLGVSEAAAAGAASEEAARAVANEIAAADSSVVVAS